MSGDTQNRWGAIAFQFMGMLAIYVTLSACTAKPAYVSSQEIPEDLPPSPGETQLGKRIYGDFQKKYRLADDAERVNQLERVVGHLSQVAGAGDSNWQVHLLDAPGIADVRAVAGNRIFVWSGLYEVILNEDELAGLLAQEIAHDLARHTNPVRFTTMSNLLFQLGSLAGSAALMVASQGAVNLGAMDWMKLAYIEVRDLGPRERHYSETEERQAASIALLMLQRSECRAEALVEFYWRSLETQPEKDVNIRLHRRLSPDQRLEILESLMADVDTQQPAQIPVTAINHSGLTPAPMTCHPAYR